MSYDLERLQLGPDIYLWKPAEDMLHGPGVHPQEPPSEEVFLGLPLGECGGVRMANIAIRKLAADGLVYGNHQPTHGADATAQQEAMGVRFDLLPDAIPKGSAYVISAHGAAPSVAAEAKARGLEVYDITCPLVGRTHRAIRTANENGRGHIAYVSFGKRDHPELVGVAGLAEAIEIPFSVVSDEADIDKLLANIEDGRTITIVGQTTNNSDLADDLAKELKKRADEQGIVVSREAAHDVCHTVRNRQRSTRQIVAAHDVDTLVVVGSVNSKNTLSLAKVAAEEAKSRELPLTIYLANSWGQLPVIKGRVGVVSGASTLAQNMHGVIDRLAPINGVTEVGEDTDRGIEFKPSHPATRRLLED